MLFISDSQSTVLPSIHQTLWSVIGIFPHCSSHFEELDKSHGVSQRSAAILKPSWCSPSVPHLDASPSGILALHLVGKLLSSVWWVSKNAEGLEEAPLPRGKI